MNRSFTLSIAVGLTAALGFFALREVLRYSSWSIYDLLPFLVGGVTTIAALFVMRTLGNPPPVTIQIALAGRPEVGKTVFANILFQRLMEGKTGLRFTPESETVLSAFQTLRGIGRGTWPPSTPDGSIKPFKGSISIATSPLRRILSLFGLTSGQRVINLTVGDSAGESWDQLSEVAEGEDSSRKARALLDSEFMKYVVESNALIYMVDAGLLRYKPAEALEAFNELRSTFQFLRSMSGAAKRGARYPAPILLVISKVDLLNASELRALQRISDEDDSLPPQFLRSLRELKTTVEILDSQCRHFTFGAFSAACWLDIGAGNEFEAGLRRGYFDLVDSDAIDPQWFEYLQQATAAPDELLQDVLAGTLAADRSVRGAGSRG